MLNSIQAKKGSLFTSKSKQIITDTLANFFIFLCLFTAYEKTIDHHSFVLSLERYSFLKEHAYWIAWLIPAAEGTTACLLFFTKTIKLGFYGALIILLCFTIGLIIIEFSNENVYCSCSGLISSLSGREHIWLNAVFIVLAIIGVNLSSRTTMNKH